MQKVNNRAFAIGDRVAMDSGRRWHGTVEALSTAYPSVPVLTVKWDNDGRSQTVNTFMMDLVKEKN